MKPMNTLENQHQDLVMVRSSEWLDLDVLDSDSEKPLGKVQSPLVDFKAGRVRGMLLDWPGNNEGLLAPIEALQEKNSALGLRNSSQLTWTSLWPNLQALFEQPLQLGQIVVEDDQGQMLGRIVDVYFERGTGRIIGYAVSQGSWDDAFPEPLFLPFEDVIEYGEQSVRTQSKAAADLEAWAKAGHTSTAFVQLQSDPPSGVGRVIRESLEGARQGLTQVGSSSWFWAGVATLILAAVFALPPLITLAIGLIVLVALLYLQLVKSQQNLQQRFLEQQEELDTLRRSLTTHSEALWSRVEDLDPKGMGAKLGRAWLASENAGVDRVRTHAGD